MAIKSTNTTPPIPPTTIPGRESALSKLIRGGTSTTVPAQTTPTTIAPKPASTQSSLSRLLSGQPPLPPSGTVKVGPVQVPRAISTTPDVLEANKSLREQTQKAIKAGVPVDTVQDIVEGKEKESVLSKIFNVDIIPGKTEFRPIKTVVAPALGGLTTGGRFVLSVNEEAIDFFKQKVLREKAQVYKATDYIPVHSQTGLPIAKPGDYVIKNAIDVANTPIPGIDAAKTPEEIKSIQENLVKQKARTTSPSFSDIKKATKDFTYSASDNPYVPSTGNKIIDGIIDFSYDVFTDPATYATFGGSAFVKPVAEGVKGATKASVAAAARQAADIAAAEAAQTAARVAADAASTAAQKTAAQQAAEAAQSAADKAFRQAAAAAPRRVYGRPAREALANNVASAKIAAQQILDDAASTAGQKIVAQDALRVLTDDFIQEIAAKGYAVIRGEAARVLGVRSGARIGLPFGPKVTIPFTNKVTDLFGTALSGSRFTLFKSEAGQKILNQITPTGEGGLFGSTDILKMRNALRSKNVPANVAADYVQLLGADTAYRGTLDLQRKITSSSIRGLTSGKNKQILQDISQHLSTPEPTWAAAGLRSLDTAERAVYDQVRDTLDKFYREADSAAAIVGAPPLPKLPDYFPRVQSTQALEWASKNVDAATKAADDLGVDKTYFLGNFTDRTLDRGKVWFGNVLDGTETTTQLNDLARPTLGFDFFELNPAKALTAYGENHAKYLAYATALEKLTSTSPARAGGLAQDISMLPTTTKMGTKPSGMELGTLQSTIARLMNPDRLQLWNKTDVLEIRSDIAGLQSKLASASPIDREAFQEALLELDEKIISTNRLIDSGVIDPTMASLLRTEIEDLANGLALAINNTTRDFLVTSPSRWQSVQRAVLDGFTVLNEKTIPDVAVRNEILEMFTNVKRLDDPAFVRAADALLRDYNTFFKSYVTLTPGFHLRNSLTNTFMMIAAGGNPINLSKGLIIYKNWLSAQKAGLTVEQFLSKSVKEADRAAVREALAYSGATGFGQIGEITQAAGVDRPGVFGREATGTLPLVTKIPGLKKTIVAREIPGLKTASEIAGLPIYGSRKLGSFIESMNRFQLTYDGIQQGFDAATAVARTQKYLIDYNDISNADRFIKQIIPFWTWASRNVPLQIENMWLNPKAYVTYNKFRDNLKDEENESAFLRSYRKEAGAFKVPFGDNLYLQPDLGFPGAGQPSLVEELFTDPEQLLGRVSPIPKTPLELWKNKQFFSGAPVTNQKSADANFDRFVYSLRQVGAPLSLVARIANATPLRRFELMQKIAGTKKVGDEQNARNEEINAGLSLFGLPFFQQLPSDEKAEIWRRFFLLLDETETTRAKEEREKQRKNK